MKPGYDGGSRMSLALCSVTATPSGVWHFVHVFDMNALHTSCSKYVRVVTHSPSPEEHALAPSAVAKARSPVPSVARVIERPPEISFMGPPDAAIRSLP